MIGQRRSPTSQRCVSTTFDCDTSHQYPYEFDLLPHRISVESFLRAVRADHL
jgi:hypothetical protein